MSRNITVISTSTGANRIFTTSATTWGELKMEIQRYCDLSSLKATENINTKRGNVQTRSVRYLPF